MLGDSLGSAVSRFPGLSSSKKRRWISTDWNNAPCWRKQLRQVNVFDMP